MSACVPKIPIDKDCNLSPREHNVRCPGERTDILTVTNASLPEAFPQGNLRLRILRTDTAHTLPALFLCQFIHDP